MQSERNIKFWRSLKAALLKEYGTLLKSMKLHHMLSERNIAKNESPFEYFLVIKEIASRGLVEMKPLYNTL